MSTSTPPDVLADHLLAEIASLEGRPYEEIGVPTFFIGHDLTADAPARRKPADPADRLGATFAHLAGALAAHKPEIVTADIGGLMQIFSDRQFPGYDATPPHVRLFDEAALAGVPEVAVTDTLPETLAEVAEGMASAHVIRAVNFHATPRYREAEFRRQIAAYAEVFEPITRDNFEDALSGNWPHERPGMIPMLFEGFRDNLDVMLPILEEYGFTGWFFVPSIFLGMAPDEQRTFAAAHELDPALTDEYPGERIALTWEEAREIHRRGHVFACHSRTHNKVEKDTPHETLVDEIVTAKAEFEAGLGAPVDIFCWLGGAQVGANPEADRLLRESGFRYLFSNFKIQKLQ